MYSGFRVRVVGWMFVVCLTTVQAGYSQDVITNVIEGYFPAQLVRGQTTVLNLAFNQGVQDPLQSIEISPSAGITIGAPKEGVLHQAVLWWEVPVTVAKDATPGPRTLVAVRPSGRTVAVSVMVPNHVPNISNLTVLSSQTAQPTVDIQFASVDQGGTLGDAPYVWFTLRCGPVPELGVVQGTVANGMIRASIPNPRTITTADAPSSGPTCNLEVRATDSAGIDSNTLTTTVELK